MVENTKLFSFLFQELVTKEPVKESQRGEEQKVPSIGALRRRVQKSQYGRPSARPESLGSLGG